MSNTNLSPLERQFLQSDIETLRLILNLIEALCYEDKKLAYSYILDDVKAEIQYTVEKKEQQIKLDKNINK